MARMTMKIALVSALALSVAGCTKKKVEDLPPAPVTEAPATISETPTSPPLSSGPVAGSRAEFLQQAGTDTILFGTDAYDIDSESQAILTKQAAWLSRNSSVAVTIEGHCDERGTREYNLALGDRRANAAKNFLVNAGISASRLSVISYGKERPAVGSSRVDLQACKLEYSIVSPK